MNKSLQSASFIVPALILIVAAGAYLGIRPQTVSTSQVFVYEEVVARPIAQKAVVKPLAPVVEPMAAPLPIMPPQVISQVLPEYPLAALEKGSEGAALIEAQIALNGMPQNVLVKSSSGNAELDSAAVIAVSKWRFSPARQGNAAMNSVFEVPVRFSIK
jgi:protein TonB